MNKRKISIILATATIASMSSTYIPKVAEQPTKNEVLLSRKNDTNKITNNNTSNKVNTNVVLQEGNNKETENNGLTKNSISITGNWGGEYKIANIEFNPTNNKIEIDANMIALFAQGTGKALKVSLYNSQGTLIKSDTYMKNDRVSNFYNDFNNLSFKYGDIVKITSLANDKVSISNFNGENNYIANKTITMEITKNGLKELGNDINVNKIYYSLNSNKVNVNGMTTANTKVYVTVDNKVYTTISNNNGAFNLNINADENITSSTNIRIYADGEGFFETTPVLNPNIYGITKNSITLLGNWNGGNYKTDVISFNPITNKINIGGSMTAYFGNFSGDAFRVELLNNEGQTIKSELYNASNQAQSLYNDFNNLGFSYGDIIKITCVGPVKTVVDNFNGESKYNAGKTISMEITQNGLKELGTNIKVNNSYYSLNSNKIEVSGTTVANTNVYVNVADKTFETKSNDKGDFDLNVVVNKNITAATNITVYALGEKVVNVIPILNPNIYGIVKNKITLLGNWNGGNYKTDVISFNPITNKINISGSMTAYFGNHPGNAFKVSLYNKDGSIIKTKTYAFSDQAQNLYNDFNNLGFNYGDIIKITCVGPVKTVVDNFNGESKYNAGKTISMEITENGLKVCPMKEIKVNPFDVLGNGEVKSGILSGVTDKPSEHINVIVNGKTFSGVSNSKGEFSIEVSDNKGFTNTTKILVETNGELATYIAPTAITNLGIEKSSIIASGKDYDAAYAQTLSFNPATMTIVNSDCGVGANSFSAQLINGKTGGVIASCATDTFNAFKSNNNINGAKFQYGDIIAVYESKETELSLGKLYLNNGKSKDIFDCTDKFKCFKITPEGLVPVANKNLTTSKALYTGTNDVSITGKTMPNTNVTISFGKVSKVVKSTSSGEFSLNIPFSELAIGSEIRVFVNDENVNVLTIQYDTKLNLSTNKIEVLNNEGVPVFDIDFNPVNNKFGVVAYPLDSTYAGVFCGNDLNIKVINPENGTIIYDFKGNKLNDINSFISQINNKPYNLNDIVEVSYNSNFVTANIYNGKNNIGNSTGKSEYFKITNKGLVNLNDKFISVNPFDILNGSEIKEANIQGVVNPNSLVTVSINGEVFKGQANSKGEFSIAVSDENGFTSNTNIVIASDGYIPTTINPTTNSKDKLMSSYINFYNNQGGYGNLISSVGFNPGTMKFVVNNYSSSFGNGSSKYFNLSLYNMNGNEILKASINNGDTTQLSNLLNNKSFSYGDIIGLSYNSNISKPVILNGNNAIGNISGEEEYFKITKTGLVPVNFGQKAETSNVYFDGNNLVVNSTLAKGQSEDTLKANKKLVILNSSNDVVESVNTSELNNNPLDTQGIIGEGALSKIQNGQEYSFALEINNKLYPINVASNIESNLKYTLEANKNNQLEISVAKAKVVNINNSSDIDNYMNSLNSNLNKLLASNSNVQDIITNSKYNNDLITSTFISTVGVSNLESFFNKSTKNKSFINWLLNNKTAMTEFLNGSAPNGTYIDAIEVWSNIWNEYSNSRNGFNLKLAIAVALTNATPIKAWPSNGYVGSPVERYNIFETLNAEGGMLPIFNTLDVRHLGYVVDTWIANNEIMEIRNIILQNHNGFINSSSNGLNKMAYTINYNETNPHTGASVFKGNFYGPNPTIKDVWYDGGVCGALSKLGSSSCQVFGIPADPVGQPGHCAFVYYNTNHTWSIGNDIYGWSLSNGNDISGWSKGIATNGNVVNYDLLYENADTKTLAKSNEYLWLAKSNISYNAKMTAINEAIKVQPLNLGAWLEKIKIMKSNKETTVKDYIDISNGIISTFKDYPMPMFDTLLQLKNEILLNGTQEEYSNFINSITKTLKSVTNSNQIKTANDMLAFMKEYNMIDGASVLTLNSIELNNIWGYGLGVITFNNVTRKMEFSKGWSLVNPYLNGEAAEISLENSSGKVLKSIILKGSEYPESQLNEFCNGLSFNFGDKLVIDYKTSIKISIKNLKTNEGIVSNYDVKKPTTIYIEKDGLTLVKPNNNLQPKDIINKKVLTKVNNITPIKNLNRLKSNSKRMETNINKEPDNNKANNKSKKTTMNNEKQYNTKKISTTKNKEEVNKSGIKTNGQAREDIYSNNGFINSVDNLVHNIKIWFDSWL